jgi:hypothetical protein
MRPEKTDRCCTTRKRKQNMRISDRYMDVVPGSRAPVLSTALLARIHELNTDYVELLLAERSPAGQGGATDALPQKVLEALGELNGEARDRLAACPFTLFSLGFDDQRFWSDVLSEAKQDCQSPNTTVAARYGVSEVTGMRTAFCEVALFLAWHAAQANRIAAQFLFALPDATAQQLSRIPLSCIRRVALDYPALLTPRWHANPAFWPDLVRFAAAGDALRLETAQLLGSQLITSELTGDLARLRRRMLSPRSRPGS